MKDFFYLFKKEKEKKKWLGRNVKRKNKKQIFVLFLKQGARKIEGILGFLPCTMRYCCIKYTPSLTLSLSCK